MTVTATLTVTDFLLARIAEDEAAARAMFSNASAVQFAVFDNDAARAWGARWGNLSRVIAECEAKRRIVAVHEWRGYCVGCDPYGDGGPEPCLTLPHLAAIYADHPDFREEWRL